MAASKTAIANTTEFLRRFDQLGIADIPIVGGKNASLGEMIRKLKSKGICVPDGFATTTAAYRHYLESTGLDEKIRGLFADLEVTNVANLQQGGLAVRQAILDTPIPFDLIVTIHDAYRVLCADNPNAAVAVRSSATA